MNLLYLPTLIALAIKYGPEVSAAIAALRQYTPLAIDVVKAIAPVIQKQIGELTITSTDDIVASVHHVLLDMGHPGLSDDEADVLANRLSQMS
jgi:hypothetical protein